MSKPSDEVRACLDELLKSDPQTFVSQLRYVIDDAQVADDSTNDLSRHASSESDSREADKSPANAASPSWLDAANAAMASGAHADAFLIVCKALCDVHKGAENMLAPDKEEGKSGAMRSTYWRFLTYLTGAKNVAATVVELRLGEPAQVEAFLQAAEGFRAEFDARWPSEKIRRARLRQSKTDLATELAWAFVRIGFAGTLAPFSIARGSRLARVVAQEYGIGLKEETLRAYAGDLLRERHGGRR